MFTYHSEQTAPAESAPFIRQSIAAFGFFPNLHKVMAEAPATYEAYLRTFELFQDKTTLTPLEQQVVMMTSNYENRCHYCTAGHTGLMTMAGMPADVIDALREGTPLADRKLEALRRFARELMQTRGHVGDARLQAFLDAGYSHRQALEVLTGLAAKLLSNYANALAHTLLDDPIKPLAWKHPDDRAAQAA